MLTAVLKRRFLICDKLEDAAEKAESSMNTCTYDSSMESSDNDSSNGKTLPQNEIYGECETKKLYDFV